MAMPSFHYNSVNQRWELRKKGGTIVASFKDNNLTTLTDLVSTTGTITTLSTDSLAVKGGSSITYIGKAVGSNAAIAAIPTGNVEVGSIAVTGVRANDTVFASPRTAPPADITVSNFRVSGSNNVNFDAINPAPDAAGSYPSMGWDVFFIR